MSSNSLSAVNISKAYTSDNYIFRNINIDLIAGESIAICGANGSGKSTLLKILAGAVLPSDGAINVSVDNKKIKAENRYQHIGFVAPYLNIYDEFTPYESARIISGMRGVEFSPWRFEHLGAGLGMSGYIHRPAGEFSSGMKQRVKYLLALLHEPEILLLDEPATNLDSRGYESVMSLAKEHCDSGGILAVATNEEGEKQSSDKIIDLNQI
jgi:heme exporter protein A